MSRATSALLIVAMALALRLYRLGEENLWHDEVYQVQVASQQPIEIVRNYRAGCEPGYCEQAPLSPLVTHFFISDPLDETLARLPSAIFGALGVGALLLVGVWLLPGRLPWVAALFLAVSPIHVWYSQEARWYSLWGLLTTLSYAALWSAISSGSRRAWAAFVATSVLGVYTFVFHFLVMLCQGLTVLLAPERRRNLVAFAGSVVTVAVVGLPVILATLGDVGLETGTPRPTQFAVLPYTFFVQAVGFSFGPTLADLHALPSLRRIVADHPGILLLAAVFAPLAAAGTWRVLADPRVRATLLPWAFGLPVLVLGVALVSNVTYQARYSFASVPAFLLLVAVGTSVARGGHAAAAVVLACLALSLGNHYWNPRYDRENVRGALARVRASEGEGARAIVIGQIGLAARHYGERLGVATVQGCEPAGTPVWLLVGRDWSDAGVACREHLSAQYVPAGRHDVTGVELWRFTLPEAEGNGTH